MNQSNSCLNANDSKTNAISQSSQEGAQNQWAPTSLPQDALQRNHFFDQSLVDPRIHMRRTNEFHWDTNDASLHHQPAQHSFHNNNEVPFPPLIPPAPVFGSTAQLQRNMQRMPYLSNLSSESWDPLELFGIPPSLPNTEDFVVVPTRGRSQWQYSYDQSLRSQPAARPPETASLPTYSAPSSTHISTALNSRSQRILPSSNDLEAVSSERKSNTKRKRSKLSPHRKASEGPTKDWQLRSM